MGYEGGDLLLTGAAWPMVGSLPKPVCAGCGLWPGWPAAPVSDESAFEVAWPPAFGVHKNALYKSMALPYLTKSCMISSHNTLEYSVTSLTCLAIYLFPRPPLATKRSTVTNQAFLVVGLWIWNDSPADVMSAKSMSIIIMPATENQSLYKVISWIFPGVIC